MTDPARRVLYLQKRLRTPVRFGTLRLHVPPRDCRCKTHTPMKKIDARELLVRPVELIGDQWMLITAGSRENFNTMTANWGTLGYLWNKPVAVVFVRPERFTYEFMEATEEFTLTFFGQQQRDALKLCGSASGRDTDKVGATGLTPMVTERGNITFEQATLFMECRKLYTDMLRAESFIDRSLLDKWYSAGSLHKMYVAEILDIAHR